jgi:hypothetical protein
VAVVALGACVAYRYRAWWTVAAIVCAMIAEVVWVTNLAGFEHVVGVTTVLGLAVARDRLRGSLTR